MCVMLISLGIHSHTHTLTMDQAAARTRMVDEKLHQMALEAAKKTGDEKKIREAVVAFDNAAYERLAEIKRTVEIIKTQIRKRFDDVKIIVNEPSQ